jgi:hypothetical protein
MCCSATTLALRVDASERDCSRGAKPGAGRPFCTLLLLAAWLCESGQEEAFSQLLAWHLLPGPAGSLRCLSPGPTPLYQSLGQLAQATLAEWQRQLPLPSPTNRFIAKRIAMPGTGMAFLVTTSRSRYFSAFSSPAVSPLGIYSFCV